MRNRSDVYLILRLWSKEVREPKEAILGIDDMVVKMVLQVTLGDFVINVNVVLYCHHRIYVVNFYLCSKIHHVNETKP